MTSNATRWVSYRIENTSTRKDVINNVTITVFDTFTQEVVGTAKMVSLDDIWIELPEVQGRYRLRKAAKDRLHQKYLIETLDDLMQYKWLISDGEYILKNVVKVKG